MRADSRRWSFSSVSYIFAVVLVATAMAFLAISSGAPGSGVAAAILGLYVLHLLSVRSILRAQRRQQKALCEQLRQLRRLVGGARESGEPNGPAGGVAAGNVTTPEAAPTPAPAVELPLPRHLALGTVAIIRDALTPQEVARVLVEQERRPGIRFGDVALDLGLLTSAKLEELLEIQHRGLFTPQEIAAARQRIEEFRHHEMACVP